MRTSSLGRAYLRRADLRRANLRRANRRRGSLRPRSVGVLLCLAGTYAWLATSLRPFTLPSLAVVPLGGLAAMALGAALLPRRPPTPIRLRDTAVWGALLAALAAWQLATFLQHPREDHPTISSLTTTLFESHPVRAAALLIWLICAAALARR